MDTKKIIEMSQAYVDEQFLAGDPHLLLRGKVPVMISAPHTVSQIRHGKYKQSESHTGVLAGLLNEDPGYHAIIKTRNLFDDANYDEKSFYRDDLIAYINQNHIHLLLDIHIMNSTRSNSLEMATGNGKNIHGNWELIEGITTRAHEVGFSIATDHLFFALNPHCIASHIATECGIPAIQMEINWRDLDVTLESNTRFLKVYKFLKGIKEIV